MAKAKTKKSARELDPHRSRELKKYDNPIPSREYIMDVLARMGTPPFFESLAAELSLREEPDIIALQRRLGAMERDGQVVRNRRGAICLVNKSDLIVGRVIGHKDGFGFLKPDDGGDDLFLTPRQMRSLFHDDRALVQVTGIDRRGRREGAVVEVLERNTHTVVGRLYCENNVGFVVPDNKRLNHDVVVAEADFAGAKHGQIVVVAIIEQPSKRTQPIGRVVEVVGEHMGPGMECDIAIRAHSIPVDWPEAVEKQIAGLRPEVDESAKQGRVDLRSLPLVTIDGEDARDFDDAVYCKRTDKGWKLLVSIADVSAYVEPGSALDQEAHKRGNSVYFPDRVVPMLPEMLSNGLCSLNPHVDRLCMTCELYFNKEGKVTRSRFYEAVMQSHARLTYNEVAEMLESPSSVPARKHSALLPHLQELYKLFQVLFAARSNRGAIEFDTLETKIIFNEQKRVERIVPLQRNDAHRLIEECMLAANVAAARLLLKKKVPALYRIHEPPAEEKLGDLHTFLGELGLYLSGGDEPSAADYSDLLDSIRERPDAHLVQTVLLRSMAQAVYSSGNRGHFGLSYDAYTHFTSPIRRYPDLIVHRALKHLIANGNGQDFEYSQPALQGLGEHCSSTERRADEATRDALDWLKCEYMMDKVGETFDGIIVSVNSFGLFVQLNEIYVEGLVHITALDNDYYHFDPIGHRLTGERGGRVYRLGDPIRVTVAAVNLDDRKIDFVLSEDQPEKPSPRALKKPTHERSKAAAKKKKPVAKAETVPPPKAKEKKKAKSKRKEKQRWSSKKKRQVKKEREAKQGAPKAKKRRSARKKKR